jgi:membrane-associated phospholipid phosphatase
MSFIKLFIRYGTWAGNLPPQLLICVVLLIIDFENGYKVGSVWFYGYAINFVIKNLVRRKRPAKETWKLEQVNGHSFPSGHSLTSMVLYWSIVKYFLIPLPWAGILYALPFALGLSRLYLRVHYISDVVAGWSIALVYILFFSDRVLEWNMQFYELFYRICHILL